MKTNGLKLSALALSVTIALTGCIDGDDGAQGAQGPQGKTGQQGVQGETGAAGENGNVALINLVELGESADCTDGATRIDAGVDANGNGTLESGEVQSSTTMCSAAARTSAMLAAGAQIKFDPVAAPETNFEKRQIMTGQAKAVNGDSVQQINASYNILARSGDQYGDTVFGQLIDKDGQPFFTEDGERIVVNSNEFTSLLPIGDRLFSVSQMESRPGAMFLMELNQNKQNGELTVKDMWQLDMSDIDGGWVHCAGSVTPWNTHLASEEYEPNARNTTPSSSMVAYLGGNDADWNPYFYGWPIEIAVDASKTVPDSELTKHYSIGRLAYELEYVMPDQKTVYLTDDGTNVGLYMFLADKEGDLSAGTMYAMKWNQTSAEGMGAADLTWINLGHATSAEIEPYVRGNKKVTFNDIFMTEEPVDGKCSAEFTSINAGGNGQECLKLVEGMDKVASRLETRRYAAMMGATTELRKEEGITFAEDKGKLYLAMSAIERGMEDGKKSGVKNDAYDLGGSNDIKLDGYNSCGGVYQLDVAANAEIGSEYVATNISGLIQGIPAHKDYGPESSIQKNPEAFDNSQNKCHIDGLANPDNVTYMSGHNTLIIGEDTGSGHQNDVIWAYDFDKETLTRIQTTPYGAETTSPYWYPNINGWAYLMSVVQHPYGESDETMSTNTGENRAYTGYVGPFPAKAE